MAGAQGEVSCHEGDGPNLRGAGQSAEMVDGGMTHRMWNHNPRHIHSVAPRTSDEGVRG